MTLGTIHLEGVIKFFHGLNPRLNVLDQVKFLVRLARMFVKGGVHTCFDMGTEAWGIEM